MKIIKAIINFFKRIFGKSEKVVLKSISKNIRVPVVLGELVSVCPGKRHAWYQSNVGIIRKPYQVI